MAAVCALYPMGSAPRGHARELGYPVSPPLPLKDLLLPCSSSRDTVPWHSAQLPARAVAQSFAVFEERQRWGSLTPFLNVLLMCQCIL